MGSRKLGGGRILGNGQSISPAAAVFPPRNTSLLSPSASSVSVNSSASTSQQSIDLSDFTSRISLEQNDENSAAVAAAYSRLVCPICNEEMVTLLQLNRHLDDNHKNLETVKQDEVKDWFKSQMVKAKRFQPLAVLNQKFKGLDVFESNDAARSPAPRSSSAQPLQPDADEIITKEHWQRHGPTDTCSEPTCGKRLTSTNGSVNCRKCGKLFCDEHTMYQIKLSRSALHEPVRGLWCRVCETCYKSREGYNDRNGLQRNHTTEFKQLRSKTVDKTLLEISRLEKRLTKLTQLLVDPPLDLYTGSGTLLWQLSGAKAHRKSIEQSVITWEDDASVLRCPFCLQEFSNYTFRRHHCRICGRVVCGDPLTECSKEVGLSVTKEKSTSEINVDVRMCKDCRNTIFSRRDFASTLMLKPPDVRAYETLIQFERGIRLMLPKFQHLLIALQDPEKPPTQIQLTDASKVRKRLIDAFTQYNVAARRLRDLPTDSPTQQLLQRAVFQQATNFLHVHMLPLKSLPKIMKQASANAMGPTEKHLGHGRSDSRPNGSVISINANDVDVVSQASSSSVISALEAEEKSLREQLIILEEQSFLVKEQIADASRRRKFDEVTSLRQNVEDLGTEIDRVQGQLAQLDFAGLYSGQSVENPAKLN